MWTVLWKCPESLLLLHIVSTDRRLFFQHGQPIGRVPTELRLLIFTVHLLVKVFQNGCNVFHVALSSTWRWYFLIFQVDEQQKDKKPHLWACERCIKGNFKNKWDPGVTVVKRNALKHYEMQSCNWWGVWQIFNTLEE